MRSATGGRGRGGGGGAGAATAVGVSESVALPPQPENGRPAKYSVLSTQYSVQSRQNHLVRASLPCVLRTEYSRLWHGLLTVPPLWTAGLLGRGGDLRSGPVALSGDRAT